MSFFSSVREIAVVGFHDRAQVANSPFPVPNRQKMELDPAIACRFCQDTGFDMRREDQVTWCDSKLEVGGFEG